MSKLYTYSPQYEWDETNAMAVIASNREEADAIFEKTKGRPVDRDAPFDKPMTVSEHEIVDGLMILPYGYDACDIEVELFSKD